MRIKLIVVDPKYQMNVGYIARVAKNFGIKTLFFVSPRARLDGKKAIMYSKHAVDLLQNARVCDSLEEAATGCDVVVGTSGRWRMGDRFEREYILGDAVKKLKKGYSKDAVVGLVLGRDDKGLNREELEECDMVLHIASNSEYPILNISHALAVILYALTEEKFEGYQVLPSEKPRDEEMLMLMQTFDRMTKNKKIRNRRSVRNIFSKMVRKAQLNRNELHAVITALK